MNGRAEKQVLCVDKDMALPAFDLPSALSPGGSTKTPPFSAAF